MRIDRLITRCILPLALAVGPAEAAIDSEGDALGRLLERPAFLPDHAITPLAASEAIWMLDDATWSLGVFGARLESVDHRRRGRPRTTISLATTATPWGRPADLLGVSLTVEDPVNRMLDEPVPRTTALTAFYGWRITSDVVLQPGITWTSDRDDPVDRVTALLALRIEF